MEAKILVSEQPKCKICGRLMESWDFYSNENKHNECISKEVTDKLISFIQNQLNKQ